MPGIVERIIKTLFKEPTKPYKQVTRLAVYSVLKNMCAWKVAIFALGDYKVFLVNYDNTVSVQCAKISKSD